MSDKESSLPARLLEQVAEALAQDPIGVFGAGFKIAELQAVGVKQRVVRPAKNFVARRSEPPVGQGCGRPRNMGLKCPLARSYRGCRIPATPPDHIIRWLKGGRLLYAHVWTHLVLPELCFSPELESGFHIMEVKITLLPLVHEI